MTRQEFPDEFIPVRVVRCRWETRYLPGKGRWEVAIEERADGPASELTAELRRPSERPFSLFGLFGEMCTLEAVIVDYFVVVDSSGRAVLPEVPTGACDKPSESALDALHRLPYRVESETPVRRVESEKTFRAGCGDGAADLFHVLGRPATAAPIWNPPPKGLRVCVFHTGKKASGMVEGKFESSRILKGERLRALLTALDTAPASDCRGGHARFAVLDTGHFARAYVELDGCRNLLRPDGTLSRLTTDAVELLTD
ncbi:hypothetical protein GCM10010156_31100 [Planobispora rosea]|uniref:Uncharacterized protein n=1 Tax=Planobispora rosea TaxID=35762 RepID=A0A8J3S447_PLARO|nr:hypothetical protein [Planobispora rosea]GGS70096.1 hypothetical protein GCM10010156_31100 [Planobispora rosea]GIH83218.1 hypothetical protein Pro02_16260 [Planobispora rosea]